MGSTSVLAQQPQVKIRIENQVASEINKKSESPPTDKQLEYAKSLGIQVGSETTFEEVSDLIDRALESDYAAEEIFKNIAQIHSINQTKLVGSKRIRNRIFNKFSKLESTDLLLKWFAFFVMLDQKVMQIDDSLSWENLKLQSVTSVLAADLNVRKSILRYEDSDLMLFGRFICDEGAERTGSSRDSIAYKAVAQHMRDAV